VSGFSLFFQCFVAVEIFMPLHETGPQMSDLTGTHARAEDPEGNAVMVSASTEVIQDYGWSAVWNMAENKYDNGEYDSTRKIPKVRVTTSDFKPQLT
jgi:hypothetical protein